MPPSASTSTVTGFFDQVLNTLPAPGAAQALRGLVAGKLDRNVLAEAQQ